MHMIEKMINQEGIEHGSRYVTLVDKPKTNTELLYTRPTNQPVTKQIQIPFFKHTSWSFTHA